MLHSSISQNLNLRLKTGIVIHPGREIRVEICQLQMDKVPIDGTYFSQTRSLPSMHCKQLFVCIPLQAALNNKHTMLLSIQIGC